MGVKTSSQHMLVSKNMPLAGCVVLRIAAQDCESLHMIV
jgi:hypothetical protein